MSGKRTNEMDQMLSEYYRVEREGPVRFHRDQTPQCASIPRLLTGLKNYWKDWTEPALTHVSTCDFCEKNLEISFRERCPKRFMLAEHRAEMSRMAPALNAHVADCAKCEKRLKSWHVDQLAALLKAGKLGRERIATLAEQISFEVGSWALAGEFGAEQELFKDETLSDDDRLRTQIWETKRKELRVRVESPSADDKGRSVRFTLRLPDGTVVEHHLTLKEDEGQSSATKTLGSIEEFRPKLHNYEFGAEWIAA